MNSIRGLLIRNGDFVMIVFGVTTNAIGVFGCAELSIGDAIACGLFQFLPLGPLY